MPTPPQQPKIYHITHVDNLPSIVAGGLVSDVAMIARGGPSAPIGMASIKERRLALPVPCHDGTCVGEFVPFYFCPRSMMLYIIHKGNKLDLGYKGGQAPIVHLEADMNAAVEWASSISRKWAFSLSNAGTYYTQFRNDLANLDEINWPAVASTDFWKSEVKEGKQSEFLMHGSFPWHLISRIGVRSREIAQKAHLALGDARHRPPVEIKTGWYF